MSRRKGHFRGRGSARPGARSTATREIDMNDTPRAGLIAYGAAVVTTAVSLLVRWPLWSLLGHHTPFMTFIPAVVISAYYGGLRPGLLATLLGAFAGAFFLAEPRSS